MVDVCFCWSLSGLALNWPQRALHLKGRGHNDWSHFELYDIPGLRVTVLSLCLKSQVAYWGLGSVLLGFGFCQYIIWDETDTICYGVPCGIIATTLWPKSKLESTNVVGCGYIEKNALYKRLPVNSSSHYKDPITIKPWPLFKIFFSIA